MAQLALESTVVSHGLPYPQNLAAAREMEQVAREHGVEPRTIGIVAGEIRIGLTDAELERFARSNGVMKVSRRDIAVAVAEKRDGATTVSATMFLASRAGIRVFATGGMGGVHRAVAGHLAWDISADLTELAATPVVVVSAGAKAILDLPATLEYLDTLRVPVLGYQTDEFPAFYSRSSSLPVQARVDSPSQAAEIILAHWDLGNPGGILVGVPVPREAEITRDAIEPYIQQALAQAEENKIIGAALTPFLLRRLEELTAGKSVETNIALLKNNVAVAAEIVKALEAGQ